MYSAWCWALLLSLSSFARADEPAFFQNVAFNEGDFGNYPKHKFKTTIIEPPRLNFMQPFSGCDDGSYIFLTPRGAAAWSSFFILDHDGGLIWGPDHRYGEVYNFQMQYFKGEPYLFFWAGDDSVGGHGEGKYYMLDSHYEEHKKLSGGKGIRGDLHAFSITKEDTALFTGYQIMQADLTSMGKDRDSWIWESIFQEMDVDTGEVLFEWRASQHFPFEDSFVNPNAATHTNPWDWFHINMVDKDEKGNFLVSSRYGRCVIYIDKNTGEIIWQLGGKGNSFKDISKKHGDGTVFLGQHDARFDFNWRREGKVGISMFDNRADWFNRIEDESVGHRIEIDTNEMTAELMQSFRNPAHILSTSQGSMQSLPNGNALLGYGYNGAFSEYSANGTILCDATMMPQERFGSGDVQSYRVLKSNWTGVPLTNPKLHFQDKQLWMSWLGSTKVRSWTLQDCDSADGLYESVQVIKKQGFETKFVLEDGPRMRRYLRILAVDGGGTQLSVSNPVDLLNTTAIWGEYVPGEEAPPFIAPEEENEDQNEENPTEDLDEDNFPLLEDDDTNVPDTQVLLVLGLLAAVSAALVAWMTVYGGCLSALRRTASEKAYSKPSRFQDDGRWRRFWHRVRISLPGGKRSWQYGKLPLPRDEREREARAGFLGRGPSQEEFIVGED